MFARPRPNCHFARTLCSNKIPRRRMSELPLEAASQLPATRTRKTEIIPSDTRKFNSKTKNHMLSKTSNCFHQSTILPTTVTLRPRMAPQQPLHQLWATRRIPPTTCINTSLLWKQRPQCTISLQMQSTINHRHNHLEHRNSLTRIRKIKGILRLDKLRRRRTLTMCPITASNKRTS